MPLEMVWRWRGAIRGEPGLAGNADHHAGIVGGHDRASGAGGLAGRGLSGQPMRQAQLFKAVDAGLHMR